MGILRCAELEPAPFSIQPTSLPIYNSMMKLLLVAMLACSIFFTTTSGKRAGQAPPNCGCQCNSYSFVDANGMVQGNCRNNDGGSRWCFIHKKNPFKRCYDLEPVMPIGLRPTRPVPHPHVQNAAYRKRDRDHFL